MFIGKIFFFLLGFYKCYLFYKVKECHDEKKNTKFPEQMDSRKILEDIFPDIFFTNEFGNNETDLISEVENTVWGSAFV